MNRFRTTTQPLFRLLNESGYICIKIDRYRYVCRTQYRARIVNLQAYCEHDQLRSVYAFEAAASAQPAAAALDREIGSASPLSVQQISLIRQLLRRKDPELRWVVGAEAALVGAIREQRPEGLDEGELRGLLALATSYLAE